LWCSIRKYSDAGQKVIVPEELRGEGRGRYVNTDGFTKNLKDERDWEAERQHGKLWDEIWDEEKKEARDYKYSDHDATWWSLSLATALHSEKPWKDETVVPWKMKEKEMTSPGEAKEFYEVLKKERQEKEEGGKESEKESEKNQRNKNL